MNSLIEAAKNGSREALGELLEHYHMVLKLKAHTYMGADLIIKVGESEVVQETLLAALQQFPQFKGCSEEQMISWLTRILLHRIQNLGKQFHSGKRDVGRETPLTKDIANQLQMPDPLDEKERDRERRAQAVAMKRTFGELPPDYQEVIKLHYHEKRPFKEVAVILDRTEEAVRKQWTRALRCWSKAAECWQKGSPSKGT